VFVEAYGARPLVRIRVVAQSPPDGIVQHVRDRVREVLVVADHPRREPIAEEMAPALVPGVEPLGVHAEEGLHPGRERVPGRVDDEVDVVPHQAEDEHPPFVLARDGVQKRDEAPSVVLVAEDHHPGDAARRHVEDPFGRERNGSRDSRHDATVLGAAHADTRYG
jgi:hypothetical protein